MKLAWPCLRELIAAGSGWGYSSSSVRLVAELERRGVQITDDAPVALHFCHPSQFFPKPGQRSVLWTFYEFEPIPQEFPRAFNQTDAVIVASRFNADLFRPFVPRGVPLVISPLGFDPAAFGDPPTQRLPLDGRPFTFLYVGDTNHRKGPHVLMEAWNARFKNARGVRLYMKMSGVGESHERRVIERGNVIWDERALPQAELRALYDDANVFVFPSLGEGFGLTALEAAASALPIVATDSGGVMEFLDPRETWMVPTKRHAVSTSQDAVVFGRRCSAEGLADRMLDCMQNYGVALKMARKQATRVRERFTWARAADSLVGHLRALEESAWKRAA